MKEIFNFWHKEYIEHKTIFKPQINRYTSIEQFLKNQNFN